MSVIIYWSHISSYFSFVFNFKINQSLGVKARWETDEIKSETNNLFIW